MQHRACPPPYKAHLSPGLVFEQGDSRISATQSPRGAILPLIPHSAGLGGADLAVSRPGVAVELQLWQEGLSAGGSHGGKSCARLALIPARPGGRVCRQGMCFQFLPRPT